MNGDHSIIWKNLYNISELTMSWRSPFFLKEIFLVVFFETSLLQIYHQWAEEIWRHKHNRRRHTRSKMYFDLVEFSKSPRLVSYMQKKNQHWFEYIFKRGFLISYEQEVRWTLIWLSVTITITTTRWDRTSTLSNMSWWTSSRTTIWKFLTQNEVTLIKYHSNQVS